VTFCFHGEQVQLRGPGYEYFGDFNGHRREFLALAREAMSGDKAIAALPDSEPGIRWVAPDSNSTAGAPRSLRRNHTPEPEAKRSAGPSGATPKCENPEVLHQVPPEYPQDAIHDRIEGRVIVSLLVSKTGSVERVEMRSGPPVFRDAVRKALEEWTFKPATYDGKPVAVWVSFPLVFQLP